MKAKTMPYSGLMAIIGELISEKNKLRDENNELNARKTALEIKLFEGLKQSEISVSTARELLKVIYSNK